MYLPTRVVVSEETPRQDRHWVLLVVDVRDLARHQCVDKIREVLIADTRQAVQDGPDGDIGGQLQPEVYAIEKRERCAEGVPYSRHSRGAKRADDSWESSVE